jgi:predicted CoA-substrate-specific enzyme activase
MYHAGIDIGAIHTKAALLKNGKTVGVRVVPTGVFPQKAAMRALVGILKKHKLNTAQLAGIYTTGYNRRVAEFGTKAITEIAAFARGALHLVPDVRTVIDIGGQGIRIISIDEFGRVSDFKTNDKCSAGTGCFLDVMMTALEAANLEELDRLALDAPAPEKINCTCTVFAESEVVSLVARGKSKESIISGLVESMASKVARMTISLGVTEEVVLAGGVARNRSVQQALEQEIAVPLTVPKSPHIVGALGAALEAYEDSKTSRNIKPKLKVKVKTKS